MVITATYRGQSYVVKATAIWSVESDFVNYGRTLPAEITAKGIKDLFTDHYGGKLGTVGVFTGAPETVNAMVMQFTVLPHNIVSVPGVKFDISRGKEGKVWVTNGGQRQQDIAQSPSYNLFPDNPNDDHSNGDEQDDPNVNDHIFVTDGPGIINNTATSDRAELRYNFVEFVRVKLDGSVYNNVNGTNDKPAVEGSRASPLVEWYALLDLVKDANGKWARNPNGPPNVVDLGKQDLGN
jgi:hypothetical protein